MTTTDKGPIENIPLNIRQVPDIVNPYYRLKSGLAVRRSEVRYDWLLPLEQSNLLPTLDHVDYSKVIDKNNPYANQNLSGPHLDPLANRLSQPMVGRIVPGSVDPKN